MATLSTFVGIGHSYLSNFIKTKLDANFTAINTELTSTTSTAGTALQDVSDDTTPQAGGDFDLNNNALIDSNGLVDIADPIVTSSTAARAGAGAIPLTASIVEIATDGADAITLADGTEGQRLSLVMITDSGDGTVTPDSFASGTTITFDDVGDTAELLFTNATWFFMGGTATVA